ncbi:hypothetical protein, partial [Streptomyces decoyicus]
MRDHHRIEHLDSARHLLAEARRPLVLVQHGRRRRPGLRDTALAAHRPTSPRPAPHAARPQITQIWAHRGYAGELVDWA